MVFSNVILFKKQLWSPRPIYKNNLEHQLLKWKILWPWAKAAVQNSCVVNYMYNKVKSPFWAQEKQFITIMQLFRLWKCLSYTHTKYTANVVGKKDSWCEEFCFTHFFLWSNEEATEQWGRDRELPPSTAAAVSAQETKAFCQLWAQG